jgi:hypothetical protein
MPLNPHLVHALLIFAAVAVGSLVIYLTVGAVITWLDRRQERARARRVAAGRACRLGEFTDWRDLGWDKPRRPRDEGKATTNLYADRSADVLRIPFRNETRPAV